MDLLANQGLKMRLEPGSPLGRAKRVAALVAALGASATGIVWLLFVLDGVWGESLVRSISLLALLVYLGLSGGAAKRDPALFLSIAGPTVAGAVGAVAASVLHAPPLLDDAFILLAGSCLLVAYGIHDGRWWRLWARHVLRRRVRPRSPFNRELVAVLGRARVAIADVRETPSDAAAVEEATAAVAAFRSLDAPDDELAAFRDEFADVHERWLALARAGAPPEAYDAVFDAGDATYRRWWMRFDGYPPRRIPYLRRASSPEERFDTKLGRTFVAGRTAVEALQGGTDDDPEPVNRAREAAAEIRALAAPDLQRAIIRDGFADYIEARLRLEQMQAPSANSNDLERKLSRLTKRWWVLVTGSDYPPPAAPGTAKPS